MALQRCVRYVLLATLVAATAATAPLFPLATLAETQSTADPLPSWNDVAAKQAILEFVKATTDQSSPDFVVPEDRIATFDQDGTTWVSHPLSNQSFAPEKPTRWTVT